MAGDLISCDAALFAFTEGKILRAFWGESRILVQRTKILLLISMLALLLMFASSCSGAAASKDRSKSKAGVTNASYICPLTGTPSTTGTSINRPALAVKIDNYVQARPQSGLDSADIVFEEPVEGGITRFVAVYNCHGSELIGPIRSARMPDVGILNQFSKPIFIHAGGITPVVKAINNSNVYDKDILSLPNITIHPPGRYAPYSTYTTSEDGWGLVPSDNQPPAPIFEYSSSPGSGLEPIAGVHIPFSYNSDESWKWIPTLSKWELFYSGTPAITTRDGSLAPGSPLEFTNVVIMSVQTFTGPYVENAEGAKEVEVNFIGAGPVIVLRDGGAISGTWKRSSLSQPAQLIAQDGSNINLTPGNTWVDLVPSTINVTLNPLAQPTSSISQSHP